MTLVCAELDGFEDETDDGVDRLISRHLIEIGDTRGLQRTNLQSMVVEVAVAARQQA